MTIWSPCRRIEFARLYLTNTSVWQACAGLFVLSFICGIQRRTVGMQDIPRLEKTLPETEILQHKVSEALGIGNNLEA